MRRIAGPLPDESPDLDDMAWARSPSDAFQCLLDLVSTARTMRRVYVENAAAAAHPILQMFCSDSDWDDWCKFTDGIDVYFWTPHTARLVSAASTSYPLAIESALTFAEINRRRSSGAVVPPPAYLPRKQRGFCVFSEPCLWLTVNGVRAPLSGLMWHSGLNVTERCVWLSLRGVAWSKRGFAAVPWWSDGGAVGANDREVDATFRDERIAFTKWICTAAMFLEQEIVADNTVMPERGVRRRADRLSVDCAPCHVVRLRKEFAADAVDSSGDSHAVDWSHRWVVRGHWRQQFFSSRGGHAPVWIHPHVKGPEDKPFIGPRPTVFAVAR